MMETVDECTVHQLKGINGKMLKTTAEEGWDLDDENDEKNLFLTMLRNIRGTGATGGIYDGSAEEHVAIEKCNMTAKAFLNFYLYQTRNDTKPNGCFNDSRKITDIVNVTLITGTRK